MLADTLVKRWDDHSPLHRMERIYARDGLPIARSTICQWHGQLAAACPGVVRSVCDPSLFDDGPRPTMAEIGRFIAQQACHGD